MTKHPLLLRILIFLLLAVLTIFVLHIFGLSPVSYVRNVLHLSEDINDF